MRTFKPERIVISAILITSIFIGVSGCSSSPPGDTATPTPTPDPMLVLGQKVPVTSESIAATGGMLTVSGADESVNGLSIEVPEGAYSQATIFDVSYRQISEHAFPAGFEPVTPVIDIDNGGAYADEFIIVTVPVDVPEGYLGVPYLHDEVTGRVEVPMVLDQTSDSMKLATGHFSGVGAVRVKLSELDGITYVTRFRPGVDDWQFGNVGSYLSGGGLCSGMTLGALWYFSEQTRNGEDALTDKFGCYSAPGGNATPGFTLDDDMGFKFCSMVQTRVYPESNLYDVLEQVDREGNFYSIDGLNFYATVAALKLTDEPVYMTVGNKPFDVRHAVICYGVKGHSLLIADPSFPGDTDRNVEFVPGDDLGKGEFKGYSTVPSAWDFLTGDLLTFEKTRYTGRTTAYRWDKIGHYFSEMTSGIVGRGENGFPDYGIRIQEDGAAHGYSLDLIDGTTVNTEMVTFSIDEPEGFEGRLSVYDYESVVGASNPSSVGPFGSNTISLQEGDNLLGFHVDGRATWKLSEKNASGEWEYKEHGGWRWAGFNWVNVVYDPESEGGDVSDVPDIEISRPSEGDSFEVGQRIGLYVTVTPFGSDATWLDAADITWTSDQSGVFATERRAETYDLDAGEHVITVKAVGSDGVQRTASVAISVIEPEEPDYLAMCNILDEIEIVDIRITKQDEASCVAEIDIRKKTEGPGKLVYHAQWDDEEVWRYQYFNYKYFDREWDDVVTMEMYEIYYSAYDETSIVDVLEISAIENSNECEQFVDDASKTGLPFISVNNPCR